MYQNTSKDIKMSEYFEASIWPCKVCVDPVRKTDTIDLSSVRHSTTNAEGGIESIDKHSVVLGSSINIFHSIINYSLSYLHPVSVGDIRMTFVKNESFFLFFHFRSPFVRGGGQ